MNEWVMNEWQKSWDITPKGREVYQLCKEVGVDRFVEKDVDVVK